MRKKERKEGKEEGGREDGTRYKNIRRWKTNSYVGNQ